MCNFSSFETKIVHRISYVSNCFFKKKNPYSFFTKCVMIFWFMNYSYIFLILLHGFEAKQFRRMEQLIRGWITNEHHLFHYPMLFFYSDKIVYNIVSYKIKTLIHYGVTDVYMYIVSLSWEEHGHDHEWNTCTCT